MRGVDGHDTDLSHGHTALLVLKHVADVLLMFRITRQRKLTVTKHGGYRLRDCLKPPNSDIGITLKRNTRAVGTEKSLVLKLACLYVNVSNL